MTEGALPHRLAIVPEYVIDVDDPRRDETSALLMHHLEYAHENTAPDDVHALDLEALLDPVVTFFSCRVGGRARAIGAVKDLGRGHAEIKSMHVAKAQRGQGLGQAMLAHVLRVVRQRGMGRVSLETGATPAFASARALYARAGFVPCGPFGDYSFSPNSVYMTLDLTSADTEALTSR